MRDVLVVGAGPAGLSVAIAAARAGLDYEVVERGLLVNAVFHFPAGMTFFTTAELLEIGDLPFITPHPKPTREEALVYYRRVADTYRLRIASAEEAVSLGREAGSFVLRTRTTDPIPNPVPPAGSLVLSEAGGEGARERTRRARNVVVATGYYDHPNRLGVPGEDLPHVSHYFSDPHPSHRRRVVVVGGGNSAAEAALVLFRSGALVTLVHRRDRLSEGVKYWVKPDLENRVREGSIAARFDSRVVAISRQSVSIESAAGLTEELPADAVFLLTGYTPDVSLLSCAGVRIDPEGLEPEHDPKTLETNVPGLYLAGAIAAGRNTNRIFIENGRFHGPLVVQAILARRAR